jgi:O-antigen/teichoic acid export membrane protein
MIKQIKLSIDFMKSRMGALGWNTLLVFIIFRCGDITNLLCKLVLGRVLPETDFGAIDPIFALLAVFSIPVIILFQAGVKSLSRLGSAGQTEQRQALARDMLRIAIIGCFFSFALVLSLRHLILTRLHLEGSHYILLIGLMVAFSWFSPMYRAIIQGTHNYRLLSIPTVTQPVTVLLLTVLLIVGFKFGLKGALCARILAEISGLILMLFILRSSFKKTAARYPEEMRHIKQVLFPMVIYVTSWTVLFHFDRLLVRNFLLNHSGGYGAITTLGSIPSFVMSSVVFVVFPMAAAEHAQGRNLKRFYHQALWIGLSITLLCTGFFALTGRPLMTLWNPAFEPYARYLWLYTLAMGIYGMIQIIASVEIARHRYRFLWIVSLPTLAMCALLYFNTEHITLARIIGTVLVTRTIILIGMWLSGRYQTQNASQESVRATLDSSPTRKTQGVS